MSVTDHRSGATSRINDYTVPASAATVHWGYFSRSRNRSFQSNWGILSPSKH